MSDKTQLNLEQISDLFDHLSYLDEMDKKGDATEQSNYFDSAVKRVTRHRLDNRQPVASIAHPPYEMGSFLFDPKLSLGKGFKSGQVSHGMQSVMDAVGISKEEARALPAEFYYAIGSGAEFSNRFGNKSNLADNFETRLLAQADNIRRAIAVGANTQQGQSILNSVAISASLSHGTLAKGSALGAKEFSEALSKNERFGSLTGSLIEGAGSYLKKSYNVSPEQAKSGIKSFFENKAVRIALGAAAVVGAAVALGGFGAVAVVAAPQLAGIVSGAAAAGAATLGLKGLFDKLDPLKSPGVSGLKGKDLNDYINDAVKKETSKKYESSGPSLG